MTQTWPAPTPPAPATRPPMHRGVRNVIVGVFLFIFALAGTKGILYDTGGSSRNDTSPTTSGSFYAAAGWSVSRAADLSVSMQRDDGVTDDVADCAMRSIVGGTTWLEWQALGTTGRFSVIRAAERAC